MKSKSSKNKHAQALGKIKSAKKAAASRENGKKGGRKPKNLPSTNETIMHSFSFDNRNGTP